MKKTGLRLNGIVCFALLRPTKRNARTQTETALENAISSAKINLIFLRDSIELPKTNLFRLEHYFYDFE